MSESRLETIEAIKQLKARYFRLLDSQDWEAWREVFSEEAQLRWGPEPEQVMVGRQAVVAGVSENLRGAHTVHHGHMPEIEVQGESRASGIWAMFDRVDHPDYLLEGYGHYHEEYVCEDGQWRIHRLTLTRLYQTRTPKPK